MAELVEIEPNRWVVRRDRLPVARSHLPLPFVISDEMPATEQVDGRYYTSKALFRAVGRAHGLTEVGTEKIKPRKHRELTKAERAKARRDALGQAVARFKAGERVRAER